jgi:myosin heavy subunit
MDDLAALHEASILHNIEMRFRMDRIYTNTGPILIAMNPFKWLPIFGPDAIKRYHKRPYGSQAPHPYQEAEGALQNLQERGVNQAMVICGESGAGKTETTKLMLNYLATVAKGSGASGMIAERMVASNPLFEAFGNAKTLRNHNSSRFGKFTRFDFSNRGTIVGGHIEVGTKTASSLSLSLCSEQRCRTHTAPAPRQRPATVVADPQLVRFVARRRASSLP